MLCYSDSLQSDDKATMVINCLMSIAGKIIQYPSSDNFLCCSF